MYAANYYDHDHNNDYHHNHDNIKYHGRYLAKSSLRSRINSSAVHWADKTVNPHMSANNMLTWRMMVMMMVVTMMMMVVMIMLKTMIMTNLHFHVSECKSCGIVCRSVS